MFAVANNTVITSSTLSRLVGDRTDLYLRGEADEDRPVMYPQVYFHLALYIARNPVFGDEMELSDRSYEEESAYVASQPLAKALPPHGHNLSQTEWEAAALISYTEALRELIADSDERTTLLSDKKLAQNAKPGLSRR